MVRGGDPSHLGGWGNVPMSSQHVADVTLRNAYPTALCGRSRHGSNTQTTPTQGELWSLRLQLPPLQPRSRSAISLRRILPPLSLETSLLATPTNARSLLPPSSDACIPMPTTSITQLSTANIGRLQLLVPAQPSMPVTPLTLVNNDHGPQVS